MEQLTEKRFDVEWSVEDLYPSPVYYDGDKKLDYDKIVELLNALHEENEQLRNELMIARDKLKGLMKDV